MNKAFKNKVFKNILNLPKQNFFHRFCFKFFLSLFKVITVTSTKV